MLLALMTLAPLVLPDAMAAGSDYDDLDSGGKKTHSTSSSDEGDEAPPARAEVVREIVRGFYMKSDVGVTNYLGTYGFKPGLGTSILRAGTTLSLSAGQDFVDNEKNSMAWEVAFNQGVFNGLDWRTNSQAIRQGLLPQSAQIEGDSRTFSLLGNFEYSIYPNRRFGVGLRAGGGVMFVPLLMNKLVAQRDVYPEFNSSLPVHQLPHPMFFGGPTLEYYTKLSHFSVGADVDVSYAVGFDLGVTSTGYFKYTY